MESTRRSFYSVAINLLGAGIAALMAAPAAAYLFLKGGSQASGDWTDAVSLADLKVGSPEEVLYSRKRVDGWKRIVEKTNAWLVRTDEKTVVAYNPSCPHLGCAYHWEESSNGFLCPCHESVFDMSGKVIAGPAPKPLVRLETKVENGRVLIGSQAQQG